MHQFANIALIFCVMLGCLIVVIALLYGQDPLIDRLTFKRVNFSGHLNAGNTAVGIVVASIILGIFLIGSRAVGAPLDRYDDAFRQQARLQFGYLYPWQTFKAQGMTESGLNPDLCSHVGACGVMQFMPGTAVGMGLKDRFDAKESIRSGVAYDRQLWRQFTAARPEWDRLAFALASYNCGLGNVLKFMRAVPEPTLWAWVAPHAWKEPREYVERIARWRDRFGKGA